MYSGDEIYPDEITSGLIADAAEASERFGDDDLERALEEGVRLADSLAADLGHDPDAVAAAVAEAIPSLASLRAERDPLVCRSCGATYAGAGLDGRAREDAYNVHSGSPRHRDAIAVATGRLSETEARARYGDR